jgi:hypothetical protein
MGEAAQEECETFLQSFNESGKWIKSVQKFDEITKILTLA